MKRAAPPFMHTPYDGSTNPFTVGLRPIDKAAWIEPDRHLLEHLAVKDSLLETSRESVFQAEAETEPAQREILAMIRDHLQIHHPDIYKVSPDTVTIGENRTVQTAPGDAPLTIAARLVQEDLVVMRASGDEYRLAAACLCFPSSWSLVEKFGQPMSGLHENVPGFNGARMGQMVARIFENLKPEQIVCRYNWSLYPDAELHHPRPKRLRGDVTAQGLVRLYVRVERQTLRRMPESGDLLFTIKIHHDPIAAILDDPDGSSLASGLAKQLRALDPDQTHYKGIGRIKADLVDALEKLGNGQLM
ncbi:DUF3445 domain-containing protein [Roseibium denhamense]|nr:DUF3445 domain-containing protein [Roseibium denhamense]